MAKAYSEPVAITWLKIQLDSVDQTGFASLDEMSRAHLAKMIFAQYGNMNVANLLQFFGRYVLGTFSDDTRGMSGVLKLTTALGVYAKVVEADKARIMRNREIEEMYNQRMEWSRKAITYDEFKNYAGGD